FDGAAVGEQLARGVGRIGDVGNDVAAGVGVERAGIGEAAVIDGGVLQLERGAGVDLDGARRVGDEVGIERELGGGAGDLDQIGVGQLIVEQRQRGVGAGDFDGAAVGEQLARGVGRIGDVGNDVAAGVG